MSLLLSTRPNKPDRLDAKKYPSKDDNEQYHLDYAKWAIQASQNTAEHSAWLKRIKRNKEFYKGDQWTNKEDLEAFLKDTTGQTKNRIKIVHNVIRPMVEQYRGNASILKINATAKSVSKLSVNRRDMALSEKIFKTQLANEFPGLGEIMRKNDEAIGRDQRETTQIFENLYVDLYVGQMNSLLKYTKELNQFDNMQIRVAQNLALSGLIAMNCFEHGGHRRYEPIESEDFFWDKDARSHDLTDAAYMGHMNPMDVSMILEKYQPSKITAEHLESFVSTTSDTHFVVDSSNTREFSLTRLPVYTVYWKDSMYKEYGYVMDEYDYPYLTRINHTYPGEDEPRYTDEDLIDPPDTPKNKAIFKGKKKRKMFLDYIRFASFIPGEVLGNMKGENATEQDKYDVLLDFGRLDYQETEMLDLSNAKFPIKCQTWGYVDGEVFSPVDDAINPQRFINRVLSVTEQLINNSGGQGVIIDEDSIDPNSKDEIYSDIQDGRPVTVRTKGKGVPNTVSTYDATPGQGVYNMLNVIPTMKQMIQDSTGVNEALKGESLGSDQLVGVTQLLIQRGSLMQEPFYNAMSNLFVQLYQDAATVGKRMYIDNERELAIITGDDGVRVLELAKDLRNEDFRVFVSRENDDSILKNQANQMLQVFMQMQLIDDKTFANLYNRSTPDDVTMALRSQAGLRIEAARRQAEEQQQLVQSQQQKEDFRYEQQRNDAKEVSNQQERMADKANESKEQQILLKEIVGGEKGQQANR